MLYLYLYIRNLLEREEGQDIIEYALLLGFIALAAVAILALVTPQIQTIWNNILAALQQAVGAS